VRQLDRARGGSRPAILFSGTVYENVTATNPNASFDDVVQAAPGKYIDR
jgi:ABC-type bacteriocin/lantibiotic exporter with double-glycine peptidase domain